jgi:hypothetical protein
MEFELDNPEALEALGMLGAMAWGRAVVVGTLLDKHAALARELGRVDPVAAAASSASLLTVPEIRASATRLEALIALALLHGDGRDRLNPKLAADIFNALGEGVAGRLEDPAEDVMVAAVQSPWGNFRILEGIWEGSSFYLQRFIDVLTRLRGEPEFDRLRSSCLALLRLSEEVCARAKLDRWTLGEEMPVDELPAAALAGPLSKTGRARFTCADLKRLGVREADLRPFLFDLSRRKDLADQALGDSALERAPVIKSNGTYTLALPTAVSPAVRYLVAGELERLNRMAELSEALCQSYAALFSNARFFGPKPNFPGGFTPSPGGPIAETIVEIDRGRFVHLMYLADALEEFTETGLTGENPAAPTISEVVSRKVAGAAAHCASMDHFKEGLTLLVGCGVGRALMLPFVEADPPNWRLEFAPAHDLTALEGIRDFTPLNLWRMLDARDRVEALGAHLMNANGLINLVGWARSLDGHVVPHGQLPDDFVGPDHQGTLLMSTNSQLGLRHESALATDYRVERFVGGRLVKLQRNPQSPFDDDTKAPLYMSIHPGPGGGTMSAYLAPRRIWWGDVHSPGAARGMAYQRWQLVNVWLSRAAPVLDRLPLGRDPLLILVSFEGSQEERRRQPEPVDYRTVRAAMEIRLDRKMRIIHIIAGDTFDDAQFNVENIAERALVAAMVHGTAELANVEDPAKVEAELLPLIVRNEFARQGHMFTARDFRDMVRPRMPGGIITISRDDDAFTRYNLGWTVRDRSLGAQIEGKAETTGFLSKLVENLENEIIAEIRRYGRRALIELLLLNHEAAMFERRRWERTASALVGLHGATPETFGTIRTEMFRSNAVTQSSRLLIEIAICEAPEEGEVAGALDISLLLAKMTLVFELGGWSDSIRWDVMKPEIRVTPLGDIHANFDWYEQVIEPHAADTARARLDDSVASYGKNLEEPGVEPRVEGRLEPAFVEAWKEQFGASIDEVRSFIDSLENLGEQENECILSRTRSELEAIPGTAVPLTPEIVRPLLDQLVLPRRKDWREVPEGFAARDIHPWRYRRRLSAVRRPLLELGDGPDGVIMFAPGMLRDGFVYTMHGLYEGEFLPDQLSPKMLAWQAKVSGERGTEFANKVADRLREDGWEARVEIKITELFNRSLDRDYGDIDVLAWKSKERRVLAIECKDLQFKKTFGEMAEQLSDFRGVVRRNGKPDLLLKHLDRMKLINTHLEVFERVIGFIPARPVESHLLFSNAVPMEYSLRDRAAEVRVTHFRNIGQI